MFHADSSLHSMVSTSFMTALVFLFSGSFGSVGLRGFDDTTVGTNLGISCIGSAINDIIAIITGITDTIPVVPIRLLIMALVHIQSVTLNEEAF
eukprot:CAMPEP_0196161012 /NCGR_PEP_ID=MMETSP0910-20130528/47118_1 /TAXON_ID=49265 /ORGANISM="Thalassiosira rotula, Strain GSO102" /LENGTH=93 /DNA_ID=CAMNT_0041425953 /DNA_START=1396 /DNA_END=1677 /DNA_ORIENTATION=+